MDFEIVPARSAEDIRIVAELFQIYTASLGIDLAYQGYEAELAGLPGKYSPPNGELLLAYTKNQVKALGCVALRPLLPPETEDLQPAGLSAAPTVCEMKRLYVSPDARGLGLGKVLAEKMIEEAKAIGYEEMRLDTLASMDAARKLYERLGFVEIEAYYQTPIPNTEFLSLDLKAYKAAEGDD